MQGFARLALRLGLLAQRRSHRMKNGKHLVLLILGEIHLREKRRRAVTEKRPRRSHRRSRRAAKFHVAAAVCALAHLRWRRRHGQHGNDHGDTGNADSFWKCAWIVCISTRDR